MLSSLFTCGSCSNLSWRRLYFSPRLFPPCIIWMLPVSRIRIRISVHEILDPDPHQSRSQKQNPDHFDEEKHCRICDRFKVKSRIWIRICIKVKSQIWIRIKVKRGIRICIKLMRIRHTGCSQRRYVGKSLLAAERKAALSLVEFSCRYILSELSLEARNAAKPAVSQLARASSSLFTQSQSCFEDL